MINESGIELDANYVFEYYGLKQRVWLDEMYNQTWLLSCEGKCWSEEFMDTSSSVLENLYWIFTVSNIYYKYLKHD